MRSEHKSDFRLQSTLASIIFMSLLSFIFVPNALAAISIENRTGAVLIRSASGEVTTVQPDQPLPSIGSGSTIEVVGGRADISASGGDTVNVIVNNSTATLSGGSGIAVNVDPVTGIATLDVTAGEVTVINEDGTEQTLKQGESTVADSPDPIDLDQVDLPTGANETANDPQELQVGYGAS